MVSIPLYANSKTLLPIAEMKDILKKRLTIVFLIFISNITLGQVNKKFIVAVNMDNVRSLELKKNKTYSYKNWTGYSESVINPR